ncbi:DNA translocase FtsK [Pseudomonas sp. LS.1a]|uniref:DNA translocase FtsK n=1 Tax=Pseudomonas sp. LS.1a TaxID=2920387 RepID=UPI001F12A451|nr:DNA translocase FtsK [Pseudomonas sp. LS.1a]UMY63901.1 DNA translocase FtsK [Pseudomonas sp. LS.1a]
MVFAHQLLVHDLVEAALFELRNIKMPFGRLGEDDQQEVIDRITKQAEDAAWTAVGIISSRSVDTIPITIADSKFKSKNITVTGVVDAQDPNRHGLVDLSGKLALLVLAPSDYAEGLDGIRAERDQHELPLSAAERIAGMGLDLGPGRQQEEEELPDGPDPLYEEALSFVRSTRRASISAIQRHLKIGYNRATRMIEQMEADGVVTPIDSNGGREVICQAEQHPVDKIIEQGDAGSTILGKEFGDYDYDDAKQLVVLKSNGSPFKAHWLQSRLALSTEQVTALLIRLLDDKVLELDEEGESSMDHIYKVVATLDQVV